MPQYIVQLSSTMATWTSIALCIDRVLVLDHFKNSKLHGVLPSYNITLKKNEIIVFN